MHNMHVHLWMSTPSPQQFIFLSALKRSKPTAKQPENLGVDKYLKQTDLWKRSSEVDCGDLLTYENAWMCFFDGKAVEILCHEQHRTSADTETEEYLNICLSTLSALVPWHFVFCDRRIVLWQLFRIKFASLQRPVAVMRTWTKTRKYFTLRFFRCPILLKCHVLLLSSLPTRLAPQQYPCIFWSYLVAEWP